jgi:hypothetical protein
MATAQQPLSPEVHHLGRKPIELESDAIVPAPAMPSLALQRAPEIVLQEAAKAAQALRQVIEQKPNKCVISGRTYLQFEDWQTLGRFYGITVAARSTTYIEYGRVQGFEAHAEAILVSTGQVISAAQAMCLDDEERWSTRPVYEYQNNRRVKVGDEKVPLFQLRSMAQTRAQAKALRNVLAWVVVMAGYQPTPAEEMDGRRRRSAAHLDGVDGAGADVQGADPRGNRCRAAHRDPHGRELRSARQGLPHSVRRSECCERSECSGRLHRCEGSAERRTSPWPQWTIAWSCSALPSGSSCGAASSPRLELET